MSLFEGNSGDLPDLPEEAFGVALSGLPGIGPARLAALLRGACPSQAWDKILRRAALDDPGLAEACRSGGRGIGPVWQRAASRTDVAGLWARHQEAGVRVHVLGRPGYPAALAADHEAPAVLYSRGDLGVLAARRVAIVGTRRCSRYGRDVARELGNDLAASGVTVVSGLALGIDGAAHSGALEALSGCPPPEVDHGPVANADGAGAPIGTRRAWSEGPGCPPPEVDHGPVAVVAGGLDVVYPRRHAALWEEVATSGVVLSEVPLGSAPESWRFPVRNRVIAALAEVVVVVESHSKGGSLHTVEAAMERDRPVMAVPGSVRSSASTFTNALLADGCAPVRDALDVLVALGLGSASGAGLGGEPADLRPAPDSGGKAVLQALEWEPATLDEIVGRAAMTPAQVSLALERLENSGWVASRSGWWEQLPPAKARQEKLGRRAR